MLIDLNQFGMSGTFFSSASEKNPFTVSIERRADAAVIRISRTYSHVFGLGECFDTLDQANKKKKIRVEEKFTEQGAKTYLPVPFFFTDTGFGIYIDTQRIVGFASDGIITMDLPYAAEEKLPDMHCFTGTPSEILQEMSGLLGASPLPPRWAFGPWISANRWDRQELVESQAEITRTCHFPASVLVIEAWSDEASFYIWNDAEYRATSGKEPLKYEDLSFAADARWPSPQKMIEKLHENGIRLILWQVPVLKKLEPGHKCLQHERDIAYALKSGYVVKNADGTPYVIPDGHWFAGSYVPDFTCPEARAWWFSKRRYLTDMGVDGWKTDGGEFIQDETALFYDGRTGKEMINEYPALYTEAYSSNNNPDQIIFSRAGYTGSRGTPIHWAGDQVSSWDEMRHVLTAGLSAGLSGIHYWGFDIAGFAGPMPDPELYCRSVQWAVFAPVMQWHSEPLGGQFSELMKSTDKVNDRSPWNIASYYGRPELADQLRFHFALRMNLLPSIYSYAVESEKTGLPMMKPLMLDYPEDSRVYEMDDEYIFGRLLIAPVLAADIKDRSVYIPEGTWIGLWTGEAVNGGSSVRAAAGMERIPVYLKFGKALLLDLDDGCEPGIWNKNGCADMPSQPDDLYLALGGSKGEDILYLDNDRTLQIRWDEEMIHVRESSISRHEEQSTAISLKDTEPVKQGSFGVPLYAIKGRK